jgi:hypothetical protein
MNRTARGGQGGRSQPDEDLPANALIPNRGAKAMRLRWLYRFSISVERCPLIAMISLSRRSAFSDSYGNPPPAGRLL